MKNKNHNTVIKKAIHKIKKTKEIIDFAYQLSISLKEDQYIDPAQICSKLIIGKPNEEYIIERDWRLYRKELKNDFALTVKINIASFAIIVCKESYSNLFFKKNEYGFKWADKEKDPDLYAAQTILKCVRDALGHFKAKGSSLNAYGYWYNPDEKDGKPNQNKLGKLKMKSCRVTLNMTKLHDKKFSWKPLGGIESFIKVLNFLQEDLEKRLKNIP